MKRLLIFGVLALAGSASAGTMLLTFDPLPPFQAATGLTVQGVTFNFSIPGSCEDFSTACYGDNIGTSDLGLVPLIDPVLSGPGAGVLTMTFAQPSNLFSFDVVLGLMIAEEKGVSVALSGPDYSGPAVLDGATNPQGILDLSVGSFSYTGSYFTQAVVTFAHDTGTTFAIDNLSFNTPDVNTPGVPEPQSWILAASGALLIGLAKIRRPRR